MPATTSMGSGTVTADGVTLTKTGSTMAAKANGISPAYLSRATDNHILVGKGAGSDAAWQALATLLSALGLKPAAGTNTSATDGSGRKTIATGLTTVTALVPVGSSANTNATRLVYSVVSKTNGDVVVEVSRADTGATINSSANTLDWLALGT